MIYKNSIRVPVLDRSKEPILAVFVGLSVMLLICFAVFGCKDMPNTATALDVANKALTGVDIAADATVEGIKIAREERVAHCRAQDFPTEEQRTACMGPLAEPIGPKVEAAAEAYDATVEALEALADAIEALEKLTREGDQ